MVDQINIILGSSRPDALGTNLWNYFKLNQSQYEQAYGMKIKLIRLSDYQLPFFYEAIPPMANPKRVLPANEQSWLDDMERAVGYVFLTPEYNHSIPGVLKNALDYLSFQGRQKPAQLISYSNNGRGGQFGAVELAPILMRLGMWVLPNFINVGNVQLNFATDGHFLADAPSKEHYEKKLAVAIKETSFYGDLFMNHPFKA